ncbi:MAG: hypothetical protein U0572_00595 [Phycisphaerales bacterium]
MPKLGTSQSSKLAPPGAGVPVKVGTPIVCVANGTSTAVGAAINCAGLPAEAPIVVSLAYDNAADWDNPPATVSVTAPPDADGVRSFTLQLIARKTSRATERASNVVATVAGSSARTVIELVVRP